jgi:AI-2 transport protein TqsA
MPTMLLVVGIVFWVMFKIATNSISEFQTQLPALKQSFQVKAEGILEFAKDTPWMQKVLEELRRLSEDATHRIAEFAQATVKWAANFLIELFVVFLYLMFMLLEANKLPTRIKKAFPAGNAERIEMTIHGINVKIANYFSAKTLSSFLLALPVTILFWLFDVKFATLWGLLTFVGNFIPYVGSAVSIIAPSLFILLDLPWGVAPLIVIGLLLACHLIGAAIMEPPILGRAVGLSPVVVLLSLTFWGTCWGFGGMLLAVPLTVMIKIIMENIAVSAPVARLLGDE